MYHLRILVIEDTLDNMDLICLILERAGHQVIRAYDGTQGVTMALQHQPDLVLLDLALPDKDGFAVAKELKSDILTKHIPIIAISAHAMPEFKAKALEAGCVAFIPKPFSLKALNKEVNRYLF
jgi:CheY-like chemotaxis protein